MIKVMEPFLREIRCYGVLESTFLFAISDPYLLLDLRNLHIEVLRIISEYLMWYKVFAELQTLLLIKQLLLME